MVELRALSEVLGCSPSEPQVHALIDQLTHTDAASYTANLDIKAYPDVVYHNYKTLGLSLQYEAAEPSRDASKASAQDLRLAAIDLYSGQEDKSWSCFRLLPLYVQATNSSDKPLSIAITQDSTGKDLVSALDEPQRKGGGAGGRSGPATWMEWSLQISNRDPSQVRPVKLQIELSGASARGPDRWNPERAGACRWEVMTISL